MTPYEEALAAVRDIADAGVRLVVIGSAALALRGAAIDGEPSDVDVIVPRESDLAIACRRLHDAGFSLAVWGEPLRLPFEPAAIEGKIYVRATRTNVQIDLLFPPLPSHLEPLCARTSRVSGLEVAETDAIVEALAASDRAKHRELAERLRARDLTGL